MPEEMKAAGINQSSLVAGIDGASILEADDSDEPRSNKKKKNWGLDLGGKQHGQFHPLGNAIDTNGLGGDNPGQQGIKYLAALLLPPQQVGLAGDVKVVAVSKNGVAAPAIPRHSGVQMGSMADDACSIGEDSMLDLADGFGIATYEAEVSKDGSRHVPGDDKMGPSKVSDQQTINKFGAGFKSQIVAAKRFVAPAVLASNWSGRESGMSQQGRAWSALPLMGNVGNAPEVPEEDSSGRKHDRNHAEGDGGKVLYRGVEIEENGMVMRKGLVHQLVEENSTEGWTQKQWLMMIVLSLSESWDHWWFVVSKNLHWAPDQSVAVKANIEVAGAHGAALEGEKVLAAGLIS
eukprot:jgi/Psemu1/45890/gm1.45890_g